MPERISLFVLSDQTQVLGNMSFVDILFSRFVYCISAIPYVVVVTDLLATYHSTRLHHKPTRYKQDNYRLSTNDNMLLSWYKRLDPVTARYRILSWHHVILVPPWYQLEGYLPFHEKLCHVVLVIRSRDLFSLIQWDCLWNDLSLPWLYKPLRSSFDLEFIKWMCITLDNDIASLLDCWMSGKMKLSTMLFIINFQIFLSVYNVKSNILQFFQHLV